MDWDWNIFLRSSLVYGFPLLVIAGWAIYRRRLKKENDALSKTLREKSQ